MANISVDTVYKTVLSILNKEQRGYLTPYEFNQIATQVQLEIFESYFESLNQQLRAGENASEYANRIKLLQEKIARFETEEDIAITASTQIGQGDLNLLTEKVHRLGTIHFNNLSYLPVEIEQVTRHEFNLNRRSKLTSPSLEWPIYYKEGQKIKILPAETSTVAQGKYTVEYVRKPKDVVWNYTVGTVGEYVHSTASPNQNFEIDDTDQTELILKILMYAGVIIRDQEIVQAATSAAMQKDQLQAS